MLKVDTRQPFETAQGALVEPWDPRVDLEAALVRLSRRPHVLFLDSARRDPVLGRYSFLTADPFDFFAAAADGSDALAELARRLSAFRAETIAGLPPFQGGAAGLLSYDLGRSLERVPRPRFDEFQTPALAVGLYDVILAVDHMDDRAWIISQGFPETAPAARRHRAAERLAQFRAWLGEGSPTSLRDAPPAASDMRLPVERLAPQFAVSGPAGLSSNFSAEAYLSAIRRAIEYIHAGDVFQVNIAQRLLARAHDDGVSLYLRLRRCNPATFAGYFDTGSEGWGWNL